MRSCQAAAAARDLTTARAELGLEHVARDLMRDAVTWPLDPAASSLVFSVDIDSTTLLQGAFTSVHGELTFDCADPVGSTGVGEVEIASLHLGGGSVAAQRQLDALVRAAGAHTIRFEAHLTERIERFRFHARAQARVGGRDVELHVEVVDLGRRLAGASARQRTESGRITLRATAQIPLGALGSADCERGRASLVMTLTAAPA